MIRSTRPVAPPRCWPGTNLPLKGFVLLAVISLLWGINWPIMKIGMEAIPVATFRAVNLAGGGVAVLALARLLGHRLHVPRAQWPMLVLASLFTITGWFLCSGYGVVLTDSGRAAIVAYTMPAWSIFFALFLLGDRLTWRRALALGLGMAAIGVLIADEGLGRNPWGPALMALAAASWGLGTVIQKKVAWQAPTLVVLGWQVLIGGIPLFVLAGFVDYSAAPSPGPWPLLALAYNVFVPFLFCYYAYFEVVRLFPVAIATLGTLFIPIVGVFSGMLVLGERPGALAYAALALVLAAMAVPALTTRPRPAPPGL